MLTITLYTRKNCYLCEETKDLLVSLAPRYPHRLIELDIESDPVLLKTYLAEIPVVEIGPYQLKAPINKRSLEITLGAAIDRRNQLEQVGDVDHRKRLDKGRLITALDRFAFWLARHYLLALNLFIFTYLGLPILAPVLMKAGMILPSRIIYKIYSPLCHQFGFRTFFLFGEQFYYPLEEAHIPSVMTFEDATGIIDASDPTSISRIEARQFIGNENLGFKMALCERDIAIYSGLLLFGILYAISGRRFKSLHWSLWILIGLGPIGLDGFSQLFSQFQWSLLFQILPYRESTPLLRVLTGSLFGFLTAWFAYPNIEESMSDTRKIYLKRFAAAIPTD